MFGNPLLHHLHKILHEKGKERLLENNRGEETKTLWWGEKNSFGGRPATEAPQTCYFYIIQGKQGCFNKKQCVNSSWLKSISKPVLWAQAITWIIWLVPKLWFPLGTPVCPKSKNILMLILKNVQRLWLWWIGVTKLSISVHVWGKGVWVWYPILGYSLICAHKIRTPATLNKTSGYRQSMYSMDG